jgi:erythromycin esterase
MIMPRHDRSLAALFLAVFATVFSTGPAASQAQRAASLCDAPGVRLQTISLLTIHEGRLAPGESTCYELRLQQGEFARIALAAEVGYLRARVIGPQGNDVQVTWTSSFATAAPSLPLAIEAAAAGRFLVEVSVPKWVPFTNAQSFSIQLVDLQSTAVRTVRRQALDRDPRVAWLRDNAHRVRTLDPGDVDFSDLQFLTDALSGVRVVVLGEGDNGGGTDVLAKTRLVKFLHERMGFDVIAFPAGIHSSSAAWRAFQAGMNPREAMLKSVFGVLARSTQADDLMRYLAARSATGRPLELAGFDSQFTGTAGGTLVPELKAFLSKEGIRNALSDDESVPSRVLAGTIGGKFGSGSMLPSVDEQRETVAALMSTALDVERRVANREGMWWAQTLRSTAVQIGLALNNARGGVSAAEYTTGHARQMAENVKWLANTAYRDRKIIIWAHTVHAIRSSQLASRSKALPYTVGDGLSEILGDRAFAIGLTSYDGRSHVVTGADDYYQDLIPAQSALVDFETLMNAAGHSMAFVNLRTARARGDWLGGRFIARLLYLVPDDAEWSRGLDGLLFIRTQQPRTRAAQ